MLKPDLQICKNLKINNNKILKVVNSFKALKYRQEIIYKNNRITIINDSKATSFSSSINVIKSLNKVLVKTSLMFLYNFSSSSNL